MAHALARRGVSADADAGRLAEPETGELPDRFLGEGAGTGDDPDLAGFVDVTGHEADLALAGGGDAAGLLGPTRRVFFPFI